MLRLIFVLSLVVVFGLLAGAAIAGAGVSPQLPDLGFDWPQWVVTAGGYLDVAANVIAAASVITALTPTPKDDSFLRIVRNVLNFLAANFYNAKPQQR